MTATAHMAACDAVVAALLAVTALAGGRVEGNRRQPMAEEHTSKIFVFLDETAATHAVIGNTDWNTRIRVECVARSASGVSAARAADALAQDVHARVMADRSLGGKAIDTTAVAMAWAQDELDTQIGVCQLLFNVWHITPDASISA